MAKSPSITADPSPAAAPASAPVAAIASGPGKASPAKAPTPIPAEEPTAMQRGAEQFMALGELLAGGQPDEEPAKPAGKAEASHEPPQPTDSKPSPASDEPKAEVPKSESPRKSSNGLLGEDEDGAATDAHDDLEVPAAGVEGDEREKAYEAKLFKAREKRRELETQLQSLTDQLTQTKRERDDLSTRVSGGPDLPPFFQRRGVKTAADVDALEQQAITRQDFLEDNADGYMMDDGTEYTAQQVKEELRNIRDFHRLVPKVREVLASHASRQQAATEKANEHYPFVLNAGKRHNDVALGIAKEYPELNQSPARALLLGRLTLAKLVEDGVYKVMPASSSLKQQQAATPAPAAPVQTRKPAATPSTPAAVQPKPTRSTPVATPQQVGSLAEEIAAHPRAALIAGDTGAIEDWAMGLVGDGGA